MMDLDEAIKHAEEVVEKHTKYNRYGGFESCDKCAEEHRQLAEWLKELKAYRETWNKLGMWLADTRLAIAPDEFLNDVDEELVRVAQVDMIDTVLEWMDKQEVEAKQNCTDCIIDGTDACSRGAGRAVDDEICGDFIPSRSEIPNTCGDAISREELIEALDTWDKFGYAPTNELVPLRGNVDKDKYVPYIHYDDVLTCIRNMPSVTPQQRTGRWIKQNYGWNWQCSECGFVTPPSAKEIFTFCPKCGAKMEVEE